MGNSMPKVEFRETGKGLVEIEGHNLFTDLIGKRAVRQPGLDGVELLSCLLLSIYGGLYR